MYQIVNWITKRTIAEIQGLAAAKRIARNLGHDGQRNDKYYAPLAYVALEGLLIYNPVFKVGRHDHFKAIPLVKKVEPGPRRCSHGMYVGCHFGCN